MPAEEIDKKLQSIDTPETDSKFFDIDFDGIVSLKPEYRGHPSSTTYPYAVSDNGINVDGSKINELPEKIIIPNVIDGTAVAGFQEGMFRNNEKIKEITIPDAVKEIPSNFCQNACFLVKVNGTEHITKVAKNSFAYTRIKKLSFPDLKEMADVAFGACCYLYSIDIGDYVTEIPKQAFQQCISLSLVSGGDKVTKIGENAFYLTYNLKNLPLLSNVTSIGKNAFYRSRIQFDWSTIQGQCTFETNATPVMDNTTDFWTGVNYTPCENRLVTVMSQSNDEWKDLYFGESGEIYYNGCAIFGIIHIHSAFTGKKYAHPDEFTEEVRAIDPSFVTDPSKHPRWFNNSVSLFQALGYKTTVYSLDSETTTITKEHYQSICNALAKGDYVYMEVSTPNDVDGGHIMVLYGINSIGEMLVLDSQSMFEKYRATGIIDDTQKYRIPLQNITGPHCSFIIVEKQ